jgi:hypothetical protein
MAAHPPDTQQGVQSKGPANKPDYDRPQSRRDRIIAVLVIAGLVVIMVLVIWLASLGGAPQAPDIDYRMMP